MRKSQLFKILFLSTYWVLAAIFITFYEGALFGFESPTEDLSYSFSRTLIIVVLVTFFAGSLMATFEVLFFTRLLRKKSFGFMIVARAMFYLANMFVFISLASLMIKSNDLNKAIFHADVLAEYLGYISNPQFLMTMIYWGLVNLFALFILQVSEKFSQGVLINFLLGKYHQPREEVRIFMFMDLKSSTSHAEKLGHIKYSQLIQDCFYDLTDVVLGHEAQIYQYVGDEVVLTWKVDKGIKNNNCIHTFVEYDKVIKNRGDYYHSKYGLIPEFKAGLNLGNVTVAEVGELKRELAYHGDVLNTAARIEGKCNDFRKRLLLSENVIDHLGDIPDGKYELVDNIQLRGKENRVNIYEVKDLNL